MDIRCNTTAGLLCSSNGAAYAACGSSSGGTTSNVSSPAATTTTLTSSNASVVSGASVTLTATVNPSAATGTVTLKDGTSTLGTITLLSGSGTYTTSSLAVGSHTLTAVYGGDSNYSTSTSAATTVTVTTPPPAAATPTASPAPGTYGSTQSITLASATSGAVIHYTQDGSTPTAASATYSSPISVANTTTIKAIASASGSSDSAVLTAAYTITGATACGTPPCTDNFTGSGTLAAPWTKAGTNGALPTKSSGTVTSASSQETALQYAGTYGTQHSSQIVYHAGGHPAVNVNTDGSSYVWYPQYSGILRFGAGPAYVGSLTGSCPAVSDGDTIKLTTTASGLLTCLNVTTGQTANVSASGVTGGTPGIYLEPSGTLSGPFVAGN